MFIDCISHVFIFDCFLHMAQEYRLCIFHSICSLFRSLCTSFSSKSCTCVEYSGITKGGGHVGNVNGAVLGMVF